MGIAIAPVLSIASGVANTVEGILGLGKPKGTTASRFAAFAAANPNDWASHNGKGVYVFGRTEWATPYASSPPDIQATGVQLLRTIINAGYVQATEPGFTTARANGWLAAAGVIPGPSPALPVNNQPLMTGAEATAAGHAPSATSGLPSWAIPVLLAAAVVLLITLVFRK